MTTEWQRVQPIFIDHSQQLDSIYNSSTKSTHFRTPSELFLSFIPFETLAAIAEATNCNYFKTTQNKTVSKRNKHYKSLSESDIRRYIGVTIFMGINRLPSYKMHWSSQMTTSPCITGAMTYNEFVRIGTWLKLSHKPFPKDMQKIEILAESLQKTIKDLAPGTSYYCIDESVIAFKGRHKLKQYLPMKPNKWGFKVFLLCNSLSGYVHKFSIFTGGEKFKPFRITKELTRDLEGVHLATDNWYSSVKLLEELKAQGILCTCTIKKSARGFPPDYSSVCKTLKHKEFCFWQKKGLLLVAYKDKALVNCITTHSISPTVVNKKGTSKPECIVIYNQVMKGVDQFDQNMSYYLYSHRFSKWWKNCMIYLIEIAIYNSYVLYKGSNSVSYLQFRIELAYQLAKSTSVKEAIVTQHKMVFSTKKKKCQLCKIRAKDSSTQYTCQECQVALHKKCFENYHS